MNMLPEKQVIPSSFEGGLRNGSIKQFDTLERVAEHYNIPLQPFLEEKSSAGTP